MLAQLVVPTTFLNARAADAVPLLRIAAGVNAMESSCRTLLMIPNDDQKPAAQLGRLHGVIAAIGYLAEIGKTIERSKYGGRFWQLVEIALHAGHEIDKESIVAARTLLSPAPADPTNLILKVRDKVGFHWDRHAFEAFLNDQRTTQVVLAEFVGPKKKERIYRGASEALAHWLTNLVPSDQGASFAEQLWPPINEAISVIGDTVGAAFLGLIIEAGERPSDYFRESTE